ncbi:MAG TPA: ribonuclease H-like domain-containing protein [Candidatus Nitrosotalea sp.]|nr:ribonuclease H-like domain-containing protein [Candidatus Nitrosotalea sp.]
MIENDFGITFKRCSIEPMPAELAASPPRAFAYFDTETSGLAGGTGTQIFAAAICQPVEGGLEVSQFFLRSPALEAAFLYAIGTALARVGGVATYNGSRFDLPLLRTRWIMARLPGELDHPPHQDLLTLTRALFRHRLPNCSLRSVEEEMLGLQRHQDLPGALVPEAWFEYLRRGHSPNLEAALAHNRQDVVSLASLHLRIQQRLSGHERGLSSGDWLALARLLTRQGRRADSWRSLRRAVQAGEGPAAALAGILLARRLSRRGLPAAADQLLQALARRLPDETELELARARILEWRLGRPEAARELVQRVLARQSPSSPYRADLEARLARLQRRAARAGQRRPALTAEPARALIPPRSQTSSWAGPIVSAD